MLFILSFSARIFSKPILVHLQVKSIKIQICVCISGHTDFPVNNIHVPVFQKYNLMCGNIILIDNPNVSLHVNHQNQ